MKPKVDAEKRRSLAGTRPLSRLTFLLTAALLALSLPLLAGCGDLNDNGFEGGLSVRISNMNELPQVQSSSGGAGEFTGQAIVGPAQGEAVLTVVVGAIVISRVSPYTNAEVSSGNLSDAERAALEDDAEQSVQFLELVQLPHPEDTISFRIPPENAGDWQLIAVGMRHSITALDQVQSDSPIWYAFTDNFQNDIVNVGDTVTLTMQPWCGPSNPSPPGTPPCP